MRPAKLLLCAVLTASLLFSGGCESESVSKTPPARSPFDGMLAHLDTMAARFEDRKDVKCWTSFKRLETFVAGCQLAPATTHQKSEVVIDLVDQIWKAAAESLDNVPSINATAFDAAAKKHFPWDCIEFLHCTLQLGDRKFIVPFQDVDNYLGTVEPIRVLQTLAQRVARQDPSRLTLEPSAVESAVRLTALLSTTLLKESNRIAAENNHEEIQDEDVLAAGRFMAHSAGLAEFDPSNRKLQHAAMTQYPGQAHEAMMANIRNKIRSLDVFNTTYSEKVLGQSFTEDLSKHEAQWALRRVGPEASKAYKEQILVSVGQTMYTACARENPHSDILTGLQMLETIHRHYPYVIFYEGVVSLFPENKDISRAWVEEFQGDAFRDTGWHWRSLERAVVALKERDSSLPALDLYAMEELSEFLSIYAVAVLRVSGLVAQERGETTVSLAALQAAHDLYEKSRKAYHAAAGKTRTTRNQQAPRPADEEEALASIDAAYYQEIFSDVTDASGIDFAHQTSDMVHHFRFSSESEAPKLYGTKKPEQMNTLDKIQKLYPEIYPHIDVGIAGGGVAVADVDADGLLDIYLVSGQKDQLWKNLGNLRFQNVTDRSGLTGEGEGRGAYFIDYDNDGDQDLFVTHVYAPNRLFRNRGDGTFEDVTQAAGLPLRGDLISHSAVWLDFDNDGYLDVYVGNFGDWLSGELPRLSADAKNGQPNLLYRNRGDGTFEDVTLATGTEDTGWAHAVSHFDANGDGWQDIYLANDFGEDVLLLNENGKRFVDATPDDIHGNFYHGMSVGFTDFNRDGVEDVYVSNIAMFSFVSKHIKPDQQTVVLASRHTAYNARMVENNVFLVSSGDSFAERHHQHFQRRPDGCGWAWDADFFDFDNDGAEDLYIANGRERNLSYNMERNVLYKQSRGHFYDVSQRSGADIESNARGVVHADFDNDGDLDMIVNNYEASAVLLQNNLQRNNWIRFELEGTSSNRDAVGALVKVYTADSVQIRTVRGGSGFLSKEPYQVHFGLGSVNEVEKIEVDWPSGRRQSVVKPSINQEHHIVEPS